MEIVVTGRHVQIPDRFRELLEERLAKVPALAPKIHRIDVVVTHERVARGSEKVEITCHAKGPVIRAEACLDDKFAALETAVSDATAALLTGDAGLREHAIAHAVAAGIRAWSVDSRSELEKLFAQVPAEDCEISPRFKLPVLGAAYDFGAKFGATPERAAELLGAVAAQGYVASLTFHPGTQCTDPHAWEQYIRTAREIADMAGVYPRRLNVGGGFPSWRVHGVEPDLPAIFDLIGRTTAEAFGGNAPELVCEPGRGLCADAFAIITRVKAVRDGTSVFLNDGVYGGMNELPVIGNLDRLEVLTPEGKLRGENSHGRVVFGPTCDSVDRLPGEISLPDNIQEGDYVVFHGAGAYSVVTNTRFNGFGELRQLTVMGFD